jgi:hypothetical protein
MDVALKTRLDKKTIMKLVTDYEAVTGYGFFDDRDDSYTMSAVRRSINGIASECGLGCFSEEPDIVRDHFECTCAPLFVGTSCRRTTDPLEDALGQAETTRRFVILEASTKNNSVSAL